MSNTKEINKATPQPDIGFELVRLAETDLAEVVGLERLVYAQPWTVDNFIGELNRRITLPLGIKKGGRLVAQCFFWLIPPEIHLLNVAVNPEFRRLGLGRRLLEAMIIIGRRSGTESIFLEVRPSNKAALDLYGSVGFLTAGRRPNYYEDGEDAVLMTLDLQ